MQSGKSSLTSWPDIKLIPQTNKQKSGGNKLKVSVYGYKFDEVAKYVLLYTYERNTPVGSSSWSSLVRNRSSVSPADRERRR